MSPISSEQDKAVTNIAESLLRRGRLNRVNLSAGGQDVPPTPDEARLLVNAVRWCARKELNSMNKG